MLYGFGHYRALQKRKWHPPGKGKGREAASQLVSQALCGQRVPCKNDCCYDAVHGTWKMENRIYDVEKEPNTMRIRRPLGTWCGYKRTGGAHGGTRNRRLWTETERKEGERNNFSKRGDDEATTLERKVDGLQP